MKAILKVSILSLLLIGLSSCAMGPTTRENVYRGVYDGSNQLHKYDNPTGISPESPTGDRQPLPYVQYSEERKRMLKKEEGEL